MKTLTQYKDMHFLPCQGQMIFVSITKVSSQIQTFIIFFDNENFKIMQDETSMYTAQQIKQQQGDPF
jgi:hypothetical protein